MYGMHNLNFGFPIFVLSKRSCIIEQAGPVSVPWCEQVYAGGCAIKCLPRCAPR